MGKLVEGEAVRESQITATVGELEIVEKDGGFFLFGLDESGNVVGGTWHATQAEAMAQAKFEYEVEVSDWT
jgi:hypothetical protein